MQLRSKTVMDDIVNWTVILRLNDLHIEFGNLTTVLQASVIWIKLFKTTFAIYHTYFHIFFYSFLENKTF